MTIDPKRLAELWAKGLNATQIAARLGATDSGVRQALLRLGVDVSERTKRRGISSAKGA